MDEEITIKSTFSNERRDWAGLNKELLALIFNKLDPQDWRVRTIPFVCRSWNDVLSGPDCWVHIDLGFWSSRVADATAVDSAVGKLVRQSGRLAKSLYAYKLGNSGFFYACTSGSFLRDLKMPMSDVTDLTLTCHIKSLSMLTTLDISYCLQLTSESIELIGNECKSLVELRRNLPPPSYDILFADPDESEALAVANTMHGLVHLELGCGRFSNRGLDAIIAQCRNLIALDVLGCWNVDSPEEYWDKIPQYIPDFPDFRPALVKVVDLMGEVTVLSL